MNYNKFREKLGGLPFIRGRDFLRLCSNKQTGRNQLGRWQKKGLLVRLKRGLFLLNSGDRKVSPSLAYLANQIYTPSYVSLESALQFYGLIPERVTVTTSVTTKKTAAFDSGAGRFTYQHVQPSAFRGFGEQTDSAGLRYFMAEPEKALVDFLHLNLKNFSPGRPEIFSDSLRLQNCERLKPTKLTAWAGLFKNRRLQAVVKDLIAFTRQKG